MARELPSGSVTLLFTDVEGSTRLLHTLGAEAYARELGEHRRRVRAACSEHGGIEVDNQGDAFFFAFPEAAGALAAATAATEALSSGPIQVRIGLHTGTPLVTDEGYVGDDVHLAARIAATGHGGQIVVSGITARSVDVELTDLGEHRLKDIDGAVPLFQVGSDAFPPLKTISNTNLPRPASTFLGRERELIEVLELVRGGARVTTLTGPGGTGKTRLAIESATAAVGDYRAGVFWVGLAPVRDWRLVMETIGLTIGARDGLADHIGQREMLLVLDNFEQVVDAASEISGLLRACPNLALIVTSRELLRIDGEVEYAVPPLARADAVALFCERSGLSPTADIEELCVRLDELPLAVELAAARTTAMSPPMILERLARRLDLLKGGRDSDPRQQTLRATIEWSYDLLSADERDLFVRLSVFAGGWTLDAAEIVAGADIDTLQSLVEKSLVRFLNDRYQMLATIREFAAELALAGDPALAQRHAEYFRDMVLHIDGQLRGANEDELMDLLEADHNNVRAALAWAAENDPRSMVRTATAMARYWWMRGTSTEARRWFELAVDISDGAEPSLIAMAKAELAYCACMASDWPTVRANGWEALAAARELGMHELALRAIPPLIDLLSFDKDWENADRLTEEGIEHARASGDLFRQAAAVYNYGESLRLRGDLPAARAKMEEALRLSEESGSQEGIASSRIGIGSVMRAQGDLDGALKILRQALAGLLEIGFRERVVWGLLEFAGIFLDQRQLDLAARLLGAADALSEGVPWNEQTDPIQNELLKELGADELGRLRAEGSKLSAAQAAELCGVQLVGSPA